jgi:hypothetical protein
MLPVAALARDKDRSSEGDLGEHHLIFAETPEAPLGPVHLLQNRAPDEHVGRTWWGSRSPKRPEQQLRRGHQRSGRPRG